MLKQFRLLAVLSILGSAFVAAGPASAKPGGNGAGKHDEIVAYWTPEHVSRARPREVSPDGRPDTVLPLKPGGTGKPGGSSSVAGASWNGGGLIKATAGKVLFTMAGVDYVCSATVVQDARPGESLAVTAGHCVFDQTDGWATNWMFMPDFDAAPSAYNGTSFNCAILPYGCWTATALVTSSGWSQGDFNEDYGFAVIGTAGHATTLEATVGAQAISFTGARPTTVYAFGYPQASPYNGTDLVYCSGPTVADSWGGSTDSGLNCNMTGGSSGGGWFSPFDAASGSGTLVSVNSFRYLRGSATKYMFGPLFDAATLSTYTAAQSAVTNTVL